LTIIDQTRRADTSGDQGNGRAFELREWLKRIGVTHGSIVDVVNSV
jgi:hypothetical protein